MDYSVVIPVYNSSGSLLTLLGEIEGFFRSRDLSYEVILVDDCSKDESWAVISECSRNSPQVKGVRLSNNRGQQYALARGLRLSRGRYAITMDDDRQHDIEAVDRMIRCAQEGHDLVFGIYADYGTKGIRHLGSRLIGSFFRRQFRNLEGKRVSSFRLIHQSVYRNIGKEEKPFVYLSAELLPFASKVGNVTVLRRERTYGRSGYTLKKCLAIGLRLHIYYGTGPLRLFRKADRNEAHINGWSGQLPDQCHKEN